MQAENIGRFVQGRREIAAVLTRNLFTNEFITLIRAVLFAWTLKTLYPDPNMTLLNDDAPAFQPAAAQRACAQIAAVVSDLGRLEGIVNDAAAELLASFTDIQHSIAGIDPRWVTTPAFGAINRAITAMQFHDLATQLVNGARQRLNATADGLGGDGETPAELKNDGDMPKSGSTESIPVVTHGFPHQPVQQHDVGVGSVELF